MVGRELRLPARADPGLRGGHDRRAADHDVDAAPAVQEPVGEGPYAAEIAEVESVDLGPVDAGQRLGRGIRPSGWNHDVRTGTGQCADGLDADPGVAAGDDRELAGQVDALENLRRGAPGAVAGSDLVLLCCHTQTLRTAPHTRSTPV